MANRKVAIVGTGEVGASFAFALMMRGIATHIDLMDKNSDLAEGHVMDLNHGMLFVPPVNVGSGGNADDGDYDMAVITAGTGQKPGETRMDLVHRNTEIFKSLIPEVVSRYRPRVLLIVTNPVDILTHVALKLSGYDKHRVIGSGTLLDSARFRSLLSRHCDVDPRNVHAYIIGEHGDSEVPVWSQVNIAGMPFADFCDRCHRPCTIAAKEEIVIRVKQAAYEIIAKKGATSFAVALSLVRIVESIFRDENSVLAVSSLVEDDYGIHDVCLSLPTILNRNGVSRQLSMDLDDAEAESLQSSARQLKTVLRELSF
ncbi:MAG: L-lactate dehydrogenase [Thermodesulfobacteriota bacterium]|nr:L-lactate dehydrogenase [Thermodesulfobacteriota bacterium]